MTFGYLIFVKTHDSIDYLQLAYGLALSIKNTQQEGYEKVALVIDDKSKLETLKSSWVFNEVIEWGEQAGWDGRAWMHDLSPWDYTVCLDSDMLFLRDHSHYIDYFIENCELYIPNKSYTFRGEEIFNDYYRKSFTANDLPNLYSFFTFFKKDSNLASAFFDLVKNITLYPKEFSNTFMQKCKPKIVGTDEAFALASNILGISDDISYDLDFPKVVHLKPMIQNFPWPANLVSDHVGLYFDTEGCLKIGNFQQLDIVHYVEKDFMTNENISLMEEIVWK